MRHRRLFAGLTTLLLIGPSVLTISAADPGVTFIGRGLVPGDASDLSGLKGLNICQRDAATVCIDQATLGGFGSAVAFTGHDNVFLAVPDRGPFDGRTNVPYLDRFHFFDITVDTNAPFPNIKTVLLDTRFLKKEGNTNLVGDAYAFDADNPPAARRFDPEGVAVSRDGNLFVSDEYGPYLYEFNRQGHLIRRVTVPSRFLLLDAAHGGHPSGDLDSAANSLELYPAFNTFGRQANRGMEGLAITPDGQWLVGIMQNALIQDNGLDAATPPGRKGLNNRIVKFNLTTGETREYVYVLDGILNATTGQLLPGQGRGVNEMLAINDHEFLVLERDNRTRIPTPPSTSVQTPNLKRIYKIDLNKVGLTDVSTVDSLPATGAALAPIVPVTKTLVIDLLDPIYKVNATQTIKDVVAEKIEGMAWGPDLPDGRHVLYVFSDNDLFPGLPTQIYAFAIDGTLANFNYVPQELPEPLYPPGQVKKALK